MSFSVTVYQNEYLSEGTREMHAVIGVASAGGASAAEPADKAVVLVVDVSGSMENPSTKISAARHAAAKAIKMLPDGTLFALVVGDFEAHCVYPPSGERLVRADATTRAEAVEVARRLRVVGGGTRISTWIDLARRLVEAHHGAIRVAYLLTDGRNEHETPDVLDAAVARAVGVLQCDTRGVGADWSVAELRMISSALLGEVEIIKGPEHMEKDFGAFMERAIGKTLPDVRLRIWIPRGATIRFFRQVAPTIEEFTDAAIAVDALTSDYLTGAWAGEESRDYHLCADVPEGDVGDERLVARVSVVVRQSVSSQGLVRAVWTDDLDRSTKLNDRVATYSDQEEADAAIREGLQARRDGDMPTATAKLRRAVQLAKAAGNEATLKLLRHVVDIDDEKGTVKFKRHVDEADEKELDVGSKRTVRVHKPTDPAGGKEAK
jgi:hypothetical protein